MSEMIERVARAICAEEGFDWNDMPDDPPEVGIGVARQDFRKQARAAIEAMQEPTSEMRVAADEAFPDAGEITTREELSARIWRVMAHKALS